MSTPLIGVAGYARTGKDTVGAYLVKNHGYERRAFADKVRELSLLTYGDIERPHLVSLGRGVREVLGTDVWLDAVLPEGERGGPGGYYPDEVPTVVTDVRYINEAERVIALGGRVWYVNRPGVKPANDEEERSIALLLAQCAPVTHLYNTGDIEQLHKQIDARL